MRAARRILSCALAAATLGAAAPASADPSFFFRPRPMAIEPGAPSLGAGALPPARAGRTWTHDLAPLAGGTGFGSTTLSPGAAFPAWLSLSASGTLSGTPATRGTVSVPVVATRGGASVSRAYELTVRDPAVTFAGSAALTATAGKPWAYDFAADARGQDLGAGGLSFSSPDRPAWLSLSADGKASGTPTATGGASFAVVATNVDAEGRHTYTVTVGGETFAAAQLAAGVFHTCALVAGGKAKCWGNGTEGQLGNGGTSIVSAPPAATVANVEGTKQLVAGGYHTCVLLDGGKVKCWGSGGSGQLGNGGTASVATPPTATVANVEGATQLAAGVYHTCVLVDGGKVKCWGNNAFGQLGNGGTKNALTPPTSTVADIDGATQLTAGLFHTCALVAGGKVKCWGYGAYGQLGSGGTANVAAPPTATVANVEGATQLVAGHYHTCALVPGGKAKCWGYNSQGQLGNGGTATVTTPPAAAVANVEGATQLAAGDSHTCALMAGGRAKCWGNGAQGQLGDGGTSNVYTPPAATVANVEGATQLVVGAYHACAFVAGGAVKCWGRGGEGQLGNGGTASVGTPPTATVANVGG